MIRSLKLVFSALLFSAPLYAATLSVGPGQTYTTIQAAVNAAGVNDTVLVYPGTYLENVNLGSKAIQLVSSAGAATTIIDGNGAGPVVIVSATGSSVNGFTIQNGGKPQTSGGAQGGISIASGVSAQIANNLITKTFCSGIVATNGNVSLIGNKISNTLTTGCPAGEGLGSAVRITGSAAATTNYPAIYLNLNTIEQNSVSVAASDTGGGGGVNITGVTAVPVYMTNNILRNNTSTGYGGGLYVGGTSSLYLIGNLIYGNKGISGGIDVVIPGSSVGAVQGIIANNTIAENTSTTTGTGSGSEVYLGGNLAQYQVLNNIIVGYDASAYAFNCGAAYASQTITPLVFANNNIYSIPGSTNIPTNSTCQWSAGTYGNISADPKFTLATAAALTAGTSNFRLLTGSPAIDTGSNNVFVPQSMPYNPNADLDSNPRPADGSNLGYRIIDMGAYEVARTSGVIAPIGSALTISPSTYTPNTGSTVTLTATLALVSPASATVTFYEDGVSIGTATGTTTVTLVTPALTSGTHVFYAVYPGDSTYSPAMSLPVYLKTITATTIATTLSLTSAPNPSSLGQAVLFSTHVTAANGTVPAGTVYFYDGAASLGAGVAVDASGNATLSTSVLAAGSRSITATFLPTNTTAYGGSTASLIQQVNGATSSATLTVNPATITYGGTQLLTATITSAYPGTPTGSVTFVVDGATVGTAALSPTANATFVVSGLAGGSHSATCTYPGDSVYGASTCNTVALTVTAAASSMTISSSKNPSPALNAVTYSSTLTSGGQPVANAPVVFVIDGTVRVAATTNAGGVAIASVGLGVTTHTIVATFAGNASAAATNSATLTETITANPTSITVIGAPNPAYQNQTISIVATLLDVTGTTSPNGTVTLYDGPNVIGVSNSPAVPNSNPFGLTFTTSNLAPGTHSLTATYVPADGNFIGSSSAPFSLTILPQTFTITSSSNTITIQTEHHASFTLTLSSVGGFTALMNLGCNTPLPPVVTCTVPNQVSLAANSTATANVTIDTDALPNFAGNTHNERRELIAFGALVPFALAGLLRRRKRVAQSLLAVVLMVFAAGLSSCSGKYPDHTPSGTYTVNITAYGTTPGASGPTTKTLPITLVVTP